MSHPSNTTTAADIPRIQLESKEDVLFVQRQLDHFISQSLSQNSSLQENFSPHQQDQAHHLVLQKLHQWSQQIWETAGPSISVNGFPYPVAMNSQTQRTEPLDEDLKNEVETLQEEADNLLLKLAEKRKKVPDQIEQLNRDMVWRESLVAELTTEVKSKKPMEDNEELPYVDERLNGEFEQALKLAKQVNEEAPMTVERLKRLADTLKDTKMRADVEQVSEELARRVLLDGDQRDTETNRLLGYKQALRAISSE